MIYYPTHCLHSKAFQNYKFLEQMFYAPKYQKGRAEILTVTFLTCNTFANWLLKKPIKYVSKKQDTFQVHNIPLWTKSTVKYSYF